jgi:hypothetical protein
MNFLGGFLFGWFGGLVRYVCGTMIRKMGLSNAPYYTLKEYLNGSERPEDDHWDKGAAHEFVNRVVGIISTVVIIWIISSLLKLF